MDLTHTVRSFIFETLSEIHDGMIQNRFFTVGRGKFDIIFFTMIIMKFVEIVETTIHDATNNQQRQLGLLHSSMSIYITIIF